MVSLQKGIFTTSVLYSVSSECVGISAGADTPRWVPMGLFGTRWPHVGGLQQYPTAGCEGGVSSSCVSNFVLSKLLFYHGRLDTSWVKQVYSNVQCTMIYSEGFIMQGLTLNDLMPAIQPIKLSCSQNITKQSFHASLCHICINHPKGKFMINIRTFKRMHFKRVLIANNFICEQ